MLDWAEACREGRVKWKTAKGSEFLPVAADAVVARGDRAQVLSSG